MNDQFSRVRSRLHSRAMAYRAVFMRSGETVDGEPWWAFWRKFKGGKLNQAGEVVLRDLRRYGYADKPTLKVSHITQQSDPIAMAFAEGRRDVYNRIVSLCNLTDDDIQRIAQRTTDD